MKKEIFILVSLMLLMSVSCIACLKAVKADNNITVNYSFSYPDQISGNTPPNSALGFVVVNMTIINNGYSSFSTNPTYFTCNETGDQYPNSPLSNDAALNNWQTVTLNNGGTYSGSLVYLWNPSVYEGGVIMGYNGTGTGQNYNVVWNYQTLTTSNSTPTPTVAPATPEFPTITILAVFLGLSLFAVTLITAKKRNASNS